MLSRINKLKNIIHNEKADCAIIFDKSDIRYFSNVISSNIALIITGDNKNFIISDTRYLFTISKVEGFEPKIIKTSLMDSIIEVLRENGLKHILLDPSHITKAAFDFIENDFSFSFKIGFTKEIRAIKCADEIKNIKKAQEISEKAFLEVYKTIKVGDTTKEISAKLDYLMSLNGSEEPAFASIVISGANTANCHGIPNYDKIKEGDFILFDFGATYNGYRSDMTRTIAVSHVTKKQQDVYNLVLKSHNIVLENLKASVSTNYLDRISREVMGDYKEYYYHSLGHGVGLDIHEYPTLSGKSNVELKSSMVITVEPGIYLENEFGVRIEDTVLVTDTGYSSFATIEKELIII